MKLNQQTMYERSVAKDQTYDGRFFTGVLTTGIYCLPSCPARKPKFDNVRFFATEAEAIAAGLRACKRCRPDLFARGMRWDEALYEGLIERVRAEPSAFKDVNSLAATAGIGITHLAELIRTHAHLTPAALLRQEQIAFACQRLIDSNERVIDLAHEAGFESEATFHRQFLATTAMTPGAYRALRESKSFLLQLPADFRAIDVLRYHGRDREGTFEQVCGQQISIPLRLNSLLVRLKLTLQTPGAWCEVEYDGAPSPQIMVKTHVIVMRMLGLYSDSTSFEARANKQEHVRTLVANHRGLRIPLAPGIFEALVWAIIGQQINLAFAVQLRRALIKHAGEPVGAGGQYTHPSPERIAAMDPSELTALRYSRSKAGYLINAAQAVCSGQLPLERLAQGSAQVADRTLRSLRGLGPWTTHYTLMRGLGLADCMPAGDSGLATGLQRLHQLPQRPTVEQMAALMAPFAPHRSLATCHVWASLATQA